MVAGSSSERALVRVNTIGVVTPTVGQYEMPSKRETKRR